ncbi:DUF2867 domain-containing protein [Paucibacter sp. Y2R2-4]|uniref:DUF2867 domain-containing protein n=1 Tax=Paucibacter sp. Y2R2-4 TaxID=2893553 RepID=UPI0021E4FCAF|nr:DUF2867 domain-containing protein [Paucibacter sp. Y2R2-4]MCV2351687.1 DUF2867 domain-containing protein [Paucibacter sp. Y2R2-4]
MSARSTISACALPAASRIAQRTAGADFADSYSFADPQPETSALQSYLALTAQTPAWMNALMSLRNQVVRWVGLKHLGQLKTLRPGKAWQDYRPGDRVGIFSLSDLHADEVILYDDDKHLRVQVSLYKAEGRIWLSTVVHEHQILGRVYMSVVGPVHKLIVPLMLAQASAKL